MAKACRVLRTPKAAQAPRAAKVAKKKIPNKGPGPASHKSKVHHRVHKKHQRKKKQHGRKVCGGAPPVPVAR